MNSPFHALDWIVLVLYFGGTLAMGFYFYHRTRSVEGYTAGNRSLPGWVCGLSILATYVSSISYLALPGKAFAGNWNAFAFSLSIPFVAIIAVKYFLPYYRKSGAVSAYELLETRFGPWARIFTSSFYLLFHIARIAVVLYLMALPMQVIFGWNIYTVLLVTGLCVTVYSLVGGLTAVIWTDAIQAIVLLGGAFICLIVLLNGAPGGPSGVLETAAANDKFSLGSFSLTEFATSTFWVIFLFGIIDNLRNFGIDQSYIQRYIASKSDAEARRSIWIGSLLYIPVSALFFFIGTTLFSYYGADQNPDAPGDLNAVYEVVTEQKLSQQNLPAESAAEIKENLSLSDVGDRVFPHFISDKLPPGLTGLLVAAIFAAAMSTVSTSLNSSATLIMNDFYKRFFNPGASEKSAMKSLYLGTILWGILGTGLGLYLVKVTNSALDVWWTLSGIIGGAMTGLFLLGLINKFATNRTAIISTLAGVIAIISVSSSSLLHAQMAPVLGVLTTLIIGAICTTLLKSK
ncbi:sodium:solute symporter [Akkermansiaceae bacterium]|nr:sodium:solute symporter [Akkermansiaceae bacterium]MDB4537922.1 sodium:solute symporter [Akkermansiaceae bacterium]